MTKRYGAILADPPWHFRTYSAKGTGRSAISHYDVMSLGEIAALPIANYAADNCVLFLWVIDTFLDQAFSLIRGWGFTYKTVGFYWAKQNLKSPTFFRGTGYWTRANPEQCLLATRGKPKRINADVDRLIVSPRREHSRKPDEVRTRIERLVAGPYLELFARQSQRGWDVLGNQAGLFDKGAVRTRRQPSRLI